MRDKIINYLSVFSRANADQIAMDLGLGPREVQETLIEMDDDGDVIMRGGWYRLSEVTRKKLGEIQ
jgi:predicted Rossmann fold nucleotide-binding protein DprA/Smf involved in DNA uptake